MAFKRMRFMICSLGQEVAWEGSKKGPGGDNGGKKLVSMVDEYYEATVNWLTCGRKN